jgi:hypothetical protein
MTSGGGSSAVGSVTPATGALFDTWEHHAFITSNGLPTVEADAYHRAHAIVELKHPRSQSRWARPHPVGRPSRQRRVGDLCWDRPQTSPAGPPTSTPTGSRSAGEPPSPRSGTCSSPSRSGCVARKANRGSPGLSTGPQPNGSKHATPRSRPCPAGRDSSHPGGPEPAIQHRPSGHTPPRHDPGFGAPRTTETTPNHEWASVKRHNPGLLSNTGGSRFTDRPVFVLVIDSTSLRAGPVSPCVFQLAS